MKNYTDEFAVDSPLNSTTLNIVCIYLVITFILCVTLNSILLLIFVRYKKLRKRHNILIFIITLLNLIASVQFPIVIHSSFEQK